MATAQLTADRYSIQHLAWCLLVANTSPVAIGVLTKHQSVVQHLMVKTAKLSKNKFMPIMLFADRAGHFVIRLFNSQMAAVDGRILM